MHGAIHPRELGSARMQAAKRRIVERRDDPGVDGIEHVLASREGAIFFIDRERSIGSKTPRSPSSIAPSWCAPRSFANRNGIGCTIRKAAELGGPWKRECTLLRITAIRAGDG